MRTQLFHIQVSYVTARLHNALGNLTLLAPGSPNLTSVPLGPATGLLFVDMPVPNQVSTA